jgi:uncharacterized membrane protein YeaQ/YmgE (transglycosylase-associated protein family)
MNIILWLILGGLSGWIASMIAGSDNGQGTLGDIVLGVLGALIGGFLMNSFGEAGVTGFNLYSLVVSVIGAIILIGLRRMIAK